MKGSSFFDEDFHIFIHSSFGLCPINDLIYSTLVFYRNDKDETDPERFYMGIQAVAHDCDQLRMYFVLMFLIILPWYKICPQALDVTYPLELVEFYQHNRLFLT